MTGLDNRDTNYAEPGVFIVRGSWGNIIVDRNDGTVIRVDQHEDEGYANIIRFDLDTLVPTELSDGSVHDETDILRTRYWLHTKEGHVRRVDPLTEDERRRARGE